MAFESPLERDFYLITDFDPTVIAIQHQPVKIGLDALGRPNHYCYPDALVKRQVGSKTLTTLYEVKSSSELEQKLEEYTPRFQVIEEYCSAKEWEFEVITEIEIRSEKLKNVKFLRGFLEYPVDEIALAHVRRFLGGSEQQSIATCLSNFCNNDSQKAVWFTHIWTFIAQSKIGADLETEFSLLTPLFLPE